MGEQDNTTTPWYRQFWPWLLISIPGITVIAGIATIWLASSEPVALVRDDYYKEGMAVNRVLAKARAAQERGLSVQLEFDAAGQGVIAKMSGDFSGSEVQLDFIHPLEIDRDQSVTLHKQENGDFVGPLPVKPDRWYLQLEGSGQGSPWRLKGEIDLRRGSSTSMQADRG